MTSEWISALAGTTVRSLAHQKDVTERTSLKTVVLANAGIHSEIDLPQANDSVITREKQLKKWNRDWKIGLIQRENPHWNDLYDDIVA